MVAVDKSCHHANNLFFFLECSSSMVSKLNTSIHNLIPFEPFYSNNIQCTWLVTAPQHQVVRFWFTKLDLAQPGDYIVIRDGSNDSASLVGNFTDKPNLNERWISSNNSLWIRFTSDNNTVGEGFDLNWKFVTKPKGTYLCANLYGRVNNTWGHMLHLKTKYNHTDPPALLQFIS